MAVYKVPQDVEADDKLIGPFSFRQFIYLIVVAVSMAIGWVLATKVPVPIGPALALVTLPFILTFGALALPLRKDQPMEAYMTALVSFYFLKSRKRFWEPDGIDSFVTIIAPKDADKKRVKDIGEEEAERRFDYLAGIVDSHGWAVRGQGIAAPASLSNELYREADGLTDMMDSSSVSNQNLSRMISDSSSARRQAAVQQMQAPQRPAPIVPSRPTTSQSYTTSSQRDALSYAQGMLEEAEDARANPSISTSVVAPSPDTIDLATNSQGLSVQAVSSVAHHLDEQKKQAEDEVFVSLH